MGKHIVSTNTYAINFVDVKSQTEIIEYGSSQNLSSRQGELKFRFTSSLTPQTGAYIQELMPCLQNKLTEASGKRVICNLLDCLLVLVRICLSGKLRLRSWQ